MTSSGNSSSPLRVATVELISVELVAQAAGNSAIRMVIDGKAGRRELVGSGKTPEQSAAAAVSNLCVRGLSVQIHRETTTEDGMHQVIVIVEDDESERSPSGRSGAGRSGAGRCIAADPQFALVGATLRAASHAGLLKSDYRANNQKVFRGWSRELAQQLAAVYGDDQSDQTSALLAESLILEQLNQVASAAVVTAVNHRRPDSILSLFDTSVWLFDQHGRRRDSYTDTDLWLAWYPGIENDDLTVDEVIQSMPASPPAKIPWIVRLFENPSSWLRFRGAIDLEDHDILHVLLGRGLQDQDEAFVLGFAMGTAKRVSKAEQWIFKFVLAHLYPEPYRIPRYLQAAFDLGIACGKETGAKNLYREKMGRWRQLSLGEARVQAGIDMNAVRRHYELEQQRIPYTISSLRLP